MYQRLNERHLVLIGAFGPVAVQSVISAATSGNLLDMCVLSPHPVLSELKSLVVGPSMLYVVVHAPV